MTVNITANLKRLWLSGTLTFGQSPPVGHDISSMSFLSLCRITSIAVNQV
jgi:hypothetical protein